MKTKVYRGSGHQMVEEHMPLFEPATRRTDPITSFEAEEKIKKYYKSHCVIICECLKEHNGSTTPELAKYLDGVLTYSQIWKRMSNLCGVYRNDKITRKGHCTWWLKEK
jgi:hypothetical protein